MGSDDVILAQITSIANKDVYAIELKSEDFLSGSLMKTSFIRPNKLFTADKRMFLQIVGKLTDKKIKEVIDKIYEFL
ncbi:MAG: type II toxin-antitoxin system PemK/MazF family toxin [Segetibacter sp.]